MSDVERIFDSHFLTGLPDDQTSAMLELSSALGDLVNDNSKNQQRGAEALLVIRAFLEVKGVTPPQPLPDWRGAEGITTLQKWAKSTSRHYQSIINQRTAEEVARTKFTHYVGLFQSHSFYEFTDDDFARVQNLITELRQIISASVLITPDHRTRLLSRLEAMQAELHKRVSDIDRFWGFVGEAGIVIRKFGEDLKPLSDRIQEIGKIVMGVIYAKEGISALPDVTHKLLGE